MRFSPLALAALSAATVRADDAAAAAESAASPVVSRPAFTPTKLKFGSGAFVEQFTDDWEKRWKPSHAKKTTDDATTEEWAYVGNWAVEEPTVYKGIDGDKGLVIKDKAAHHAISAKFPKAITNKKDTLVVQYEVKLQDGLECGGAYLKLLQDNKALHAEEFSNASPYVIMFGPDKCGSTNKVHFIVRHKNPKTGEYEEKHMDSPPLAKIEKTSSLYTLIVRPDQTFEVKVNGESAKNGSLFEDFTPSFNPPKEIDDPKDSKPEDWIDDARMADPEATKPADWDEEAPYEIVDEEATKPDDWLENEPATINDPEAEKPEDWDDEEDGDWVAPKVSNPKCDEVSGCGPWKKPLKKNPDYKGKWTAPFIDNPAYKGPWAPRKIKNPDYFEDKTPSNLEPIGAIGFEIWTMQKDILFDNIYIGHSEEEAVKLQKETFDIKHPIEKTQEEADKPKVEDTPVTEAGNFKEDPVKFIRTKLDVFWTLFKSDPVAAVKTFPETAGAIGGTIVTIIALLATVLGFGAAAAPTKEQLKAKATQAKGKVVAGQEKASEAVTTAAENVKDGVNKRQTRSAVVE